MTSAKFFELLATIRGEGLPLSSWIRRFTRVEPWPKKSFKMPPVQAHRGYWRGGLRQNSLEALMEARQRGALMAEFDVRLSRDRVPVLFHDPDIVLSDGRKARVRDLSLSELRAVGPITTLEEILASDEVTAFLNIELKSELALDEPLERFVAPLIERHQVQGRVLFSSFNPFSIWKISRYLPEVPRALLHSSELEEKSLREMWFAPFLPVHLLHLDHQDLNAEAMKEWKHLRVPIATWTVNERKRMEDLLSWGVVSVITDDLI